MSLTGPGPLLGAQRRSLRFPADSGPIATVEQIGGPIPTQFRKFRPPKSQALPYTLATGVSPRSLSAGGRDRDGIFLNSVSVLLYAVVHRGLFPRTYNSRQEPDNVGILACFLWLG